MGMSCPFSFFFSSFLLITVLLDYLLYRDVGSDWRHGERKRFERGRAGVTADANACAEATRDRETTGKQRVRLVLFRSSSRLFFFSLFFPIISFTMTQAPTGDTTNENASSGDAQE